MPVTPYDGLRVSGYLAWVERVYITGRQRICGPASCEMVLLRVHGNMRLLPVPTRSALPLLIENIILYVTMCESHIRPSSERESVLLRAREAVHRDIPVAPKTLPSSQVVNAKWTTLRLLSTRSMPQSVDPERNISVQDDARVNSRWPVEPPTRASH